MGVVYRQNKVLLDKYPDLVTSKKVVPNYFKEPKLTGFNAGVIEPGKASIDLAPVATLEKDELELILLKLDTLAESRQDEGIAVLVTEEIESILATIRLVKQQTAQPYLGILGSGAYLDIMWLRPKDVGGALLNPAATASLGLYAGTSGGVYTWLNTFTANTSADIIPAQVMYQWAGMVHLGAIDTVEVPKIDAIKFTLAGLATPPQSVASNIKRFYGIAFDLTLQRWEKPVIIGPLKKQQVTLMPYITGDSKFELLSLLIARAQDLVL